MTSGTGEPTGQGAGNDARKQPPIAFDERETWGGVWLAIGLLLFGGAVGLFAGLSQSPGTTSTLLTGLFSFVGGSLLSYAGFLRRKGEQMVLSRNGIGVGLGMIAIGLVVGGLIGIDVRVKSAWEVRAALRAEAAAQKEEPKASKESGRNGPEGTADKPDHEQAVAGEVAAGDLIYGAHGGRESRCAVVQERLDSGFYSKGDQAAFSSAVSDLRWMARCVCAAGCDGGR